MHRRHTALLLSATLLLLASLPPASATAQEADSMITRTLDPIVVTAERVASTLSSSTVGVSVLSARELRKLPNRNASSLLGFIPGMTFLDFDGMGYAPQSVTRGFYGGGEAEYVILMINGKPVNNLENGMINWEQITNTPGTTIEVLRGGASSVYGDAAIGAVVNVRTDAVQETTRRVALSGGNFGVLSANAAMQSDRYSALVDYDASDGFRNNSERSSATFQGSYELMGDSDKSLSVNGSVNVREFDTPGPLRTSDLRGDGSESLAFFQFDGVEEETYRVGLDGSWRLDAGLLRANVSGELRSQDMVRTLPLSADFADTQERNVDASGVRAGIQLSELSLPLGIDNKLVIGVDGFVGSLDTGYHHIATGGLGDAYLGASGDRGDLLSDGTANRNGGAGYAHLEINPSERLNISLGARGDWINDSFDEVAGLSEAVPSASHSALSPKAGLNYRYSSSSNHVGNVYLSASKSFKAPTLDQLYDLRAFPVPFPPFAIQISNAELIPQEGTSYEIGFYHRVASSSGWSAMISTSAYTIDMTNELDFSFDTFSNVNIGESRHRGIETGIKADNADFGSLFVNYTLQDVTHQVGENKGNAVKAIPRHAFSSGVMTDFGPVSASVVLRGTRKTYVDDANTTELDDYATVDARVSYSRGDYLLSLDVFNALDKEYDSTAYQDPAGSDVLFIFPAATRTVALGIEISF